jgi:hypothetical protein
MIFKELVQGMCMLDLVVTDEFGEPFFFCCEPVFAEEGKYLFDNKLNMEFDSGRDEEYSVCSIKFENKDKTVQFLI